MKKFVSLLIIFTLILSLIPTAYASGDIRVYINNEPIEKNGIIISDRTYLPVRALCEKIGIQVNWVDETKSVILGTPPLSTVKTDSVNIYLNGTKLETAEAVIIDSTTYLPVRALCEQMNMSVLWKAETREVFVSSVSDLVFEFLNDECFLNLDSHTKERFTTAVTSKGIIGKAFSHSLEGEINGTSYFNRSKEEKEKYYIENIITLAPYSRAQVGKISAENSAQFDITTVTYKKSHDVWRGDMQPVWIYSVVIYGDTPDKSHYFEYISTVEDEDRAFVAASALSRFPYGVRKLVKRITDAPSSANTFNGGGDSIWIRLNYLPSENSIAQNFACTLGFILSSASKEYSFWADAIKEDILPVSKFGQTNMVSDFGEFSTLYFNVKDLEGGLEELEAIYPNRFRVFTAMLYSVSPDDFPQYKSYYDNLYSLEETKESNRQYFTLSLPNTNLYLTHIDNNDDFAYFKEYTGEDNQLWYEDSIGTNTIIKSKASRLILSPMRDIDNIMIGGIYMADPKAFFPSEADGKNQAVTITKNGNMCTIYFNKMGAYLGQYSSDETRAYPVNAPCSFILNLIN